MTAFVDDPLLAVLERQTELVLNTAASLTDGEVLESSRLPGWTRGHVLAHLARNADGFVNLVRTAATGVEQPMYAFRQARDADIERDAGRSAGEQLTDLQQSAGRLREALAQVPVDAVDRTLPTGMGAMFPVGNLPWLRLRELAYHHVDLCCGFTFADLPDEVLRAGLVECENRLGAAQPQGADGITARCPLGSGGELSVRLGDGAIAVSGAAADVLGWLTGRTVGRGVRTGDGSPLPDVPVWG